MRYPTLASLSAMFLMATSSTPSQALSNDELIDLAIGAVNPDLRPARPIIVCAIGGTAVETCAKNAANGQISEKMGSLMADISYTVYIYELAKSGNFPKLVSSLGLTVACAAFGQVPGSGIVCNTYAGAIVNFSASAINKTGSIAKEVGTTVVNSLVGAGTAVTCFTGIYCPDDDKDDPNKFNYHFPGGKLSIVKFDIAAVWQNDFVPRLGEGIAARLTDPDHLARMIAVPQPRLGSWSNPSGGSSPNSPAIDAVIDQVGVASYFLSGDALGSGTVNQRVSELLAIHKVSPLPANLLDVNAQAFEPLAKELNARWVQEVNKAAGELLADYPVKVQMAQQSWRNDTLPKLAVDHFDWAIPHIGKWQEPLLQACRDSVEAPLRTLVNWGAGAARAHDNGYSGPATLVGGQGPAYWAGRSRNWCGDTFNLELAGRRQSFDAAISWGCVRRKNGEKGLDCPAEPKTVPAGPKVVMTPDGPKVVQAQSSIGVVPVELCREAYAPFDNKYCRVATARQPVFPGLFSKVPIQRRTQPGPSPSPAPTTRPSASPQVEPPPVGPVRRLPPVPQPDPTPSPEATLLPVIRRPG
ncbi:hypothetical protein [Novosphingobium sp.]|uniref:hypothetical protein n=1 Tax=Novosphingobium sp. TaxID=1874826 RepID=UPI00286B1C83|nr:hypothetical protein [Novosphingobium sp.]